MTSKKDIFALWQKRDSEQADLPDIARLTTNTSANISGITLKKVKELQSPTGMRKGNGAYNSPRKIALSAKVVDRTNAPHSNTSEHSNSRHHTSEEANAKRAEFTKKRHDFRKSKRASMTTPIKMGNVAAAPIHDLDNFVPPIFAKADADVELIEDALKHNFVFENLKHNELTKMIKAFEKMRVHNGEVIINQGDTGDYFYIIGSGKVRFQVNGKTVGSAMAGKSFGELSLLYSSARAASVIAESDPTVLFRVDQKTFRHVMQTRSKESESEKMDLLKGINFLKDFNNLDLQRLSDCMVPRYFQKDDIVVSKGEVGEAFYVLQKGMMKVTDISVGSTSYEDVTLTPGDYFGERALITSEPRAANVVGCEAGTCFLIDRGTFEKVLGNFSRVILRAQDKIKLEGVKVIKEAGLEAPVLVSLAAAIKDEEFKKGDTIQEENKDTEAALYLIREGIVSCDCNNTYAGGYFGEEQLLSDAQDIADKEGCIRAVKTVVCETDVVCGVLRLRDCRVLFDTRTLNIGEANTEKYIFGNSVVLKRRSTIKESFKTNSLSVSDLHRDELLGEGQFGEVWIVKADVWGTGDDEDIEEFALKIQNLENPEHEGIKETIKREIDVISSLEHPFIVDLVTHHETQSESLMLMTVVKGGELWNVVHKEQDDGSWLSGISENNAKFYSLVIADTLAYMHHKNILFRDLKPENVLIDSEGYPNIIDFGFAKFIKDGDKTYTFCGTPNYVAPEIVLSQGHSVGVDHWALGIMIYEMISGENPFYYDGLDNGSLFEIIAKEEPYACENASADVENLIGGLLEKDQTQRLGVLAGREGDILTHKWFDELDLDLLRGKVTRAPWIPPIADNAD